MKKKIIIGVLIAALIAGGTAGGAVYYRKSHQSEVSVVSVDSLASQYYTDDTSLEGNIATSAVQSITIDKDMIVQDVYVSKGDTVKKGDKLVSFDMTLVQMELKIAKLKQEQQEQNLAKAQKRLASLQNGGPVEESDAGSDSLNADQPSDTDTSSTGDELASAGSSLNGVYLAAVMNPILAAAMLESTASTEDFTDTQQEASSEEADTSADVDFGSDDTGEDDTEPTPIPEQTETPEETPIPTPTETPGADQPQDDFVDDVKIVDIAPGENKDKLMDGESQFVKILNDETEPITGTGTKDDPFVFLCDSSEGYVVAKGSFLNKMAQFNSDGTRDAGKTGYWYQLEFHQNNQVADYQDRKSSCIGYYLIDGNLLDKRVDNDSEIEYTLDGASQYEDELPDDDGGDYDNADDSGNASITRDEAIKIQKSRIQSLSLDIRESKLNISKLEKKVQKETIYSRLDGTVAKVGDSTTSSSDGSTFMTVKSKEGYYVKGTVSELMLDQIKEGTELKSSTSNGDFNAKVAYVSEYPVSGDSSYYGSGNPNASYYEYTATIEDSSVKVSDDDWLTVMLAGNVVSNGIVLDRAFVRTENGVSYVYKDDNGVLKKQILKVGGNVNSGYSVLVTGGITREDKIAFPYGDDVADGVKTKEVSADEMYGY